MGLLGMAFHPNFPTDNRVFLSYTTGTSPLVSRISAFRSTDGGATLDPNSEQVLLTVNQPEENHNGGLIAFGLVVGSFAASIRMPATFTTRSCRVR